MTARLFFIALPLSLALGCFAGEPTDDNPIPSDDEGEEDVQLSLDATEGIEGTADIAILSGMFVAPAAADNPAQAAAESIKEALADDRCASVSTDLRTFLEVTFDDCVIAGTLLVDGVLRAEISKSNTATTFALSATDLVIGATTTSGSWAVTADPATHTASFSGDIDFTGPLGGTVTATADATLDIDAQCVDYSISGELTRMANASYSAQNVTRCWGVCPASGDVTVSVTAQTTRSLSWSYDGTGQVIVTTGSGVSFPVTLPCSRN